MTLIDGIKGSAAVAAMWCGRPRGSGVCQRGRLQRIHAPSLAFGWVLKAADMKSVRLGSAQCGIAQPILTLSGQRRYTDERERVSKRFGLMLRSRRATSRSGGLVMVPCQRKAKISAHHNRNLGNPRAEKVLQDRSQMLFA